MFETDLRVQGSYSVKDEGIFFMSAWRRLNKLKEKKKEISYTYRPLLFW